MSLKLSIRSPRLVADLDVAPGEVLACIGENGAGKSTLLRLIAGVAEPSSGHLQLGPRLLLSRGEGRPEHCEPAETRSLAWMPQGAPLLPHLDARDNVAFACGGQPRAAARREAELWLHRFGAEGWARQRPDTLSGGERHAVALARTFARPADAILLDEPFAAMDAAARIRARAAVAEHRGSRPVLLVTHDARDVRALADRIALLVEGHLFGMAADERALLDALPRGPSPSQLFLREFFAR